MYIYLYMTINNIRNKAFKYGATAFGKSKAKNKKYFVIYNNKIINFGDARYEDYTTTGDKVKRSNYRKRASKIKNKYGQYTFSNKNYPNFWAYHLLW